MGTNLNLKAYKKIIEEDIEWLLRQPRTLERDHIEQVLRDYPQRLSDLNELAEGVLIYEQTK